MTSPSTAAARGAKRKGGGVVGISPGLSLNEHAYKYESPTAHHRDNVASRLPRFDDPQLVFGGQRIDANGLDISPQSIVCQLFQLGSRDRSIGCLDQCQTLSDGEGSRRMIVRSGGRRRKRVVPRYSTP